MDNHDIEQLVREADDAFWQVIAARFPEATSGDLSPPATVRLERAAIAAVTEWIDNNVPPRRHCRSCGSEIVEEVNGSSFRDGECGPCECRRYRSQPALLGLAQALLKECADRLRRHADGHGNPGDRQKEVEYWNGLKDRCQAAITHANAPAA